MDVQPAPGTAAAERPLPGLRVPTSRWTSKASISESARHGFQVSPETLLLAVSLFWAFGANRLFVSAALQDRVFSSAGTWGFALALLVMLTALHYLLLGLLAAPLTTRRTIKPLLAVLLVTTAFATYFMQTFGVYLDTTMLRNVLRTNPTEARELMSWSQLPQLLPHLLLNAVLPLALLWRVRVAPRSWLRAAGVRAATLLAAAAVFVGTLLLVFQPFASLMRNHKEVRYLATPVNYLWGLGAVAAQQTRGAARPRQPIGLDARPGPAAAMRSKPLVVVLVVGETARAASWGLNGYARQTTPELARLAAGGNLVSWRNVTSCGTNTETSLPCMFAPVGRRDYDESRIRGSESLLHVLARAGVAVHWRDNQSGCKGVCDGLPQDQVMTSVNPQGLCSDGNCLDEGLLSGMDERLAAVAAASAASSATRRKAGEAGAGGTAQLLVLHQLGNHGPAYFRRYPAAFKRFAPACESDDLQRCTREQIVNAYDNALLYTDHVLASLIAKLQAVQDHVDTALVYVSDHGESLGEGNMYLHGMPYAIAPAVQTHVPMLMWLSPGFAASTGLDRACLQRRAEQPAAHDHLFHTLLGMLDVQTALHEPAFDLVQGCRSAAAATGGATVPPAPAAVANTTAVGGRQ